MNAALAPIFGEVGGALRTHSPAAHRPPSNGFLELVWSSQPARLQGDEELEAPGRNFSPENLSPLGASQLGSPIGFGDLPTQPPGAESSAGALNQEEFHPHDS